MKRKLTVDGSMSHEEGENDKTSSSQPQLLSSSSSSSSSLGQLANLEELQSIVSCFPQEIDYAFGYGSGVFAQQQLHTDKHLPMIDLIFSVPDPQAWHEQNLQRHPDHYAPLCRTLGSKFIATVQTTGGAKLFFNPLFNSPIPKNDDSNSTTRQIKYGVIHTPDIQDDLLHWKYLYVAGRLHKPTVFIPLNNKSPMEAVIHTEWQQHNLAAAMSTSLLLHSSSFSHHHDLSKTHLQHIFETIASLSYQGDPRMKAGAEDPLKVKKLVQSDGQFDRFTQLYKDSLSKLEQSGLVTIDYSSKTIDLQNIASSQRAKNELWNNLPSSFSKWNKTNKTINTGDTIMLSKALENVVAPAAKYQSMKGLITAGLIKSFRYAVDKFAKGSGAKILKFLKK